MMEEIAKDPLLKSSDEIETKNKNAKKYILLCICVSVGLLVGVLIGYLSFRPKNKPNIDSVTEEARPLTVDWVELLPAITEVTLELGKEVINLLSSSSVSYSSPKGNDHWFTCSNGRWGSYDGQVMSLYYHEYKKHSATTCGKLGEKRSIADAGHWAISIQTRRLTNNTAYYNDDVP